MGRCLAFNFSPEELKQKLKDVHYFVYSPDFDSAGDSSNQHFFATLDIRNHDVQAIKEALKLVQLQGSVFRFSQDENKLFVYLDSRELKGAISDRQIADVHLVDQELLRMSLPAATFVRYQDVVFGDKHFHAKDLSRPFAHTGILFVPKQSQWSVGKSYEEALSQYEASQKR